MEKTNRTQRHRSQRRHSRRTWLPEDDSSPHQRPPKRLFTPEIKRLLKEWLIRRRENPYPSREEKKYLALETGLTYTQICNWFANWRRKLKNSESEETKKSWGHLIKNYNTNAKGNVEQFSISSEDSIWEEEERHQLLQQQQQQQQQHYYYKNNQNNEEETLTNRTVTYERRQKQISPIIMSQHSPHHPLHHYYLNNDDVLDYNICTKSSVIESDEKDYEMWDNNNNNNERAANTKYKQKIMEKYLRDTQPEEIEIDNELSHRCSNQEEETTASVKGSKSTKTELTKWLESANKFTPNKNNYFIEWNDKRQTLKTYNKLNSKPNNINTVVSTNITPLHHISNSLYIIHQKDELDAAEALTSLAFNCRQKMLESSTKSSLTYHRTLNVISS